jgi:PIN domain nuclease of toxin-antitoxin system
MGSIIGMRYLLDTHIWLWTLLEPDKLDSDIAEVLRNRDNELFLSPITVWETLILAEKERIELYPSPKEWVLEALKRSPVKEAKLSHAIALKSRLIELPHKDPADRFIAATAWEYDLTLITVDEILREAKQIKVL